MSHKDAIAIIGASCQLPGANSLKAFWDNLEQGRSSVSEIPDFRWDKKTYVDRSGTAGKSIVDRGGFIKGFNEFDPLFFSIVPEQACLMDPQHRIALQEGWNALDNGGYGHFIHREKNNIGVFVGARDGDYINSVQSTRYRLDGGSDIGSDNAFISGRISYFLKSEGPSLTINTACSSSLVAVYLACKSLQLSECDMALAGGVTVNCGPEEFIHSTSLKLLSRDATCRAFDSRANGFVIGEGCGFVLLKRLSDAIKSKDLILAVVKGIGISHVGRSNGIMTPKASSQSALIEKVASQASVSLDSISLVEAHGTGTKMGDPIEFQGLLSAFNKQTKRKQYCALGSVKTNIGHTIAASGIASLLKVILSIRNKKIPATLNFSKPNPLIDLDNSPFFVNSDTRHWSTKHKKRRATVSSYGLSGTNAFCIIEEYKELREKVSAKEKSKAAMFIPISAKSKKSLNLGVEVFSDWVNHLHKGVTLKDIAHTYQMRKAQFNHRTGFLVSNIRELKNQFSIYKEQGHENFNANLLRRCKVSNSKNVVSFLEQPTHIVNWRDSGGKLVGSPGYSFEKAIFTMDQDSEDDTIKSDPALGLNDQVIEIPGDSLVANDHQVAGEKIFPATGYILILNKILRKKNPQYSARISEMVLHSPFVLGHSGARLSVKFKLFDGTRSRFEFVKTDSSTTLVTGEIEHISNQYSTERETWSFLENDKKAIRSVSGNQFYSRIKKKGVEYGSGFRNLQKISINQEKGEILSEISPVRRTGCDFDSEYSEIMALDSLLHGADVLTGEDDLKIPYLFDNLSIFSDLKNIRFSKITKISDQRFHIRVFDESGNECLKIENLTLRKPQTRSARLLKSFWIPSPTNLPDNDTEKVDLEEASGILIFGLSSVTSHQLSDELRPHYFQINHETKYENIFDEYLVKNEKLEIKIALSGTRFHKEEWVGKALRWAIENNQLAYTEFLSVLGMYHQNKKVRTMLFLTEDAVQTTNFEKINPLQSSMAGLSRSFCNEYRVFNAAHLDLSSLERSDISVLFKRYAIKGDDRQLITHAIRRGKIYRKNYSILNWGYVSPTKRKVSDAVYIVAGGSKGVGFELAKHLHGKYQSHLIVASRSTPSDEVLSEIDKINEGSKNKISHRVCDISKKEDLKRLIAFAKRNFSQIAGVFHCAFVLKDAVIKNVKAADFQTTYAPKVAGSLLLHTLLLKEKIGFLCYFSSMQSIEGNAGQAVYSSASSFQDSAANLLRRRSRWDTYIINWGLWGVFGSATSPSVVESFRGKGVFPMSPYECFQVLDFVLKNKIRHSVVVDANDRHLQRLGVINRHPIIQAKNQAIEHFISELTLPTIGEIAKAKEERFLLEEISRLATSYLLRPGALTNKKAKENFLLSNGDKLDMMADYRPLFRALDFIASNHLRPHSARNTYNNSRIFKKRSLTGIFNQFRISKQIQRRNSNFTSNLALLEMCITNFEKIVSGDLNAEKAMFGTLPTSIFRTIYTGDVISQTYKKLIANYVCSLVSQYKGIEPMTILEVGAGTGSLSTYVLETLKNRSLGSYVYYYTDASQGLLDDFRKNHGENYSKVEYCVFDIKADTIPKELGRKWDIVLASNVLHILETPENAIRKIKRNLSPDGYFLVHELTAFSAFNSLTFGLLKTWWPSRDTIKQGIPHSPLYTPSEWMGFLGTAGFDSIQKFQFKSGKFRDRREVLLICRPGDELDEIYSSERERGTGQEKDELIDKKFKSEASYTSTSQSGFSNGERDLVVLQITRIFSQVLRMDPEAIDINQNFYNLGIDSLVSLGVIGGLESEFGKLPDDILTRFSSIAALANFFQHSQDLPSKTQLEETLKKTKKANVISYTNETDRVKKILRIISAVSGIPMNEIDKTRKLSDLGIDSLSHLALLRKLEKELDVSVPASLFEISATLDELIGKMELNSLANGMHKETVKEHPSGVFEITENQKALWTYNKLFPKGTSYNVVLFFQILGAVDYNKFKKSIKEIVAENSSLNSVFVRPGDGNISQKSGSQGSLDVVELEFDSFESLLTEAEPLSKSKFDLQNGPLARAYLMTLKNGSKYFLFTVHHIAFDGQSTIPFVKSIYWRYSGKKSDQEFGADPRRGYEAFQAWQKKYLMSQQAEIDKAYWASQLSDLQTPITIPFENSLSREGKPYKGALINQVLPADLSAQVHNVCGKLKVTKNSFYLTAYILLLFKYTSQKKIVTGTAFHGRPDSQFVETIGYFSNVLPFISEVDPNGSARELLDSVALTTNRNISHGHYPFLRILNDFRKGKPENPPIFKYGFIFQNFIQKINHLALDEKIPFELKPMFDLYQSGEFALTVEVVEAAEETHIIYKYFEGLFVRSQLLRMHTHFLNVISQILKNVDSKIKEIDILPKEERISIDVALTGASCPLPETNIVQLFESVVRKHAHRQAIQCDGESIDYWNLNRIANRFSDFIQKKGVSQRTIIPIVSNNSLPFFGALLGCLKAGCAYLPLDASVNEAFIEGAVRATGSPVVLLDKCMEIRGKDYELIGFGKINLQSLNPEDFKRKINPQDFAYAYFTSGTTGVSKCATISHEALLNFSTWRMKHYDFSSSDRTMQTVQPSFDGFCANFFPTILAGGCYFVTEPSLLVQGEKAMDIIQKERITNFSCVPSIAEEIFSAEIKGNLDSLRFVALGGEASSQRLIQTILGANPKIKIFNEYGPTENTVTTTVNSQFDSQHISNIGRPIQNNFLKILNHTGEMVPVGVSGELYISGKSLFSGYLGTNSKNSFAEIEGKKYYATGDLVRLAEDLSIEYLGRNDDQLKISGVRINLSLLENVISDFPGVKACKVLTRFIKGNRKIAVFTTARPGFQIEATALRRHIYEKTIHNLSPNYFIEIQNFPLTKNGKLDVDSMWAYLSRQQKASPTAPKASMEKFIHSKFLKVLGVEKIGLNDNFYESGGNSIRSIQLISELKVHGFGIKELLENPSISGIASFIAAKKEPAHYDSNLQIDLNFPEYVAKKNNAGLRPKYRLDIPPIISIPYRTCFYSALFNALAYLKKDINIFLSNESVVFRLFRLGKLSLGYSDQKVPLKENLKTLGVDCKTVETSDDILRDIKAALFENRPVIVMIDCFYEPNRSDLYQKSHWPHSVLVYGYDETSGFLNILENDFIDSYEYRKMKLRYSDLLNCYDGYLRYFKEQSNAPTLFVFSNSSGLKIEKTLRHADIYREAINKNLRNMEKGIEDLNLLVTTLRGMVDQEQKLKVFAGLLTSTLSKLIQFKELELRKCNKFLDFDSVDLARVIKKLKLLRMNVIKIATGGDPRKIVPRICLELESVVELEQSHLSIISTK